MAMMTSDQIDHLHVLRDIAIPQQVHKRKYIGLFFVVTQSFMAKTNHHDIAIPNSSELIHLSHRVRLWSFEEFRGASFF